ncbi:MAG: DNA internalization-related competence protein ComEC/Rec2 [Acidobacteriota bacterium]
MDCPRTIDPWRALRHTASPALEPTLGLLAGVVYGLQVSWHPLSLVMLLLALGLALAGRPGRVIAGVACGLLIATLKPLVEPSWDTRRPVEVVGVVHSHPLLRSDELFFRVDVQFWRQRDVIAVESFELQVVMPPSEAQPVIGTKLRLKGHVRRSKGFNNRPETKPGPWRMRLKSPRFLTVVAPPRPLLRVAGALRRVVEEALAKLEVDSGPGVALTRALLLGDRSQLPRAWEQTLRRCGLGHLLAVSGLHVGLVAVLLFLVSRPLSMGARLLPAALGITIYLLLVGPLPSVSRAAAMGLLGLGAFALQRPPQGLNALMCCVAVWIAHHPSIVTHLGFQLSVAATAGILVLLPAFVHRWHYLPPSIRGALAVSVAAQLVTMPIFAPLSGGIHPLSPLYNLIAIPWLTVCLVTGVIATFAMVLAGVDLGLGCLLDWVVMPLQLLADLGPLAGSLVPIDLSPWSAGVVAALAAAWGLWPARVAKWVLVIWCLVQTGAAGSSDPELVVLDVGQGDAVVVHDGRRAVLIDGGGWPHGDLAGRVLVPALAGLGIRHLDAVMLTHPDTDHCRGLVGLSRYVAIRELWMGPGWLDERCVAELLAAKTHRWRVLWGGESARVGRWKLRVLHPRAGARRGSNDRSLVVMAEALGHRVLLTGDVEASGERQMVAGLERRGQSLRADVLKVAHHGSKTSTTESFLRAVSPRIAIVSCGFRNRFGHPHPKILERLRAVRAHVLRTDLMGMIRLRFRPGEPIYIERPYQPLLTP